MSLPTTNQAWCREMVFVRPLALGLAVSDVLKLAVFDSESETDCDCDCEVVWDGEEVGSGVTVELEVAVVETLSVDVSLAE